MGSLLPELVLHLPMIRFVGDPNKAEGQESIERYFLLEEISIGNKMKLDEKTSAYISSRCGKF